MIKLISVSWNIDSEEIYMSNLLFQLICYPEGIQIDLVIVESLGWISTLRISSNFPSLYTCLVGTHLKVLTLR